MVIYVKPKNIPARATAWAFWVSGVGDPYVAGSKAQTYGQYDIPTNADAVVIYFPDELNGSRYASWSWAAIQADGGAMGGAWQFGSYLDYLTSARPFVDKAEYTLDMATGKLDGIFAPPKSGAAIVGAANLPADADFWTLSGMASGQAMDSGPLAPYVTSEVWLKAADLSVNLQAKAGQTVYDDVGNLVGVRYIATVSLKQTLTIGENYKIDFALGKTGGEVKPAGPGQPGDLPPSQTTDSSVPWLIIGAVGVMLLLAVKKASQKKSFVKGQKSRLNR